jgi:SHS2 domain-containing protein
MYRWVDHTGEMELEIEAADESGVYAAAVEAIGDLMREEQGGEPLERRIDVSARDRPALLAATLEELIFASETEEFLPVRVVDVEAGQDRVRVTVEGERQRPSGLVKAVTYHRLRFEPAGDAWRATVVFDV